MLAADGQAQVAEGPRADLELEALMVPTSLHDERDAAPPSDGYPETVLASGGLGRREDGDERSEEEGREAKAGSVHGARVYPVQHLYPRCQRRV